MDEASPPTPDSSLRPNDETEPIETVVPDPFQVPTLDSSLDGSTDAPAGEPFLARYRLTRLHARGGIGQVWLARDELMGRQVALKELRPDRRDAGTTQRDRFVEEAKITGQLEHPGIVPVYELARQGENALPFYTMRFVQGRTLLAVTREYHRKRKAGEAGRLELDALLNAFVAVCNTLAYAHSRGVIHRDLKGENIVLGDYGEVVVLDWGLAKVFLAEDAVVPKEVSGLVSVDRDETFEGTRDGQVMGTPAYIPPEQATGRLDLVGPRSDVYGLGAILYEIIAGHPPFRGRDAAEILQAVVLTPPPRPFLSNPEAPPALEAVCLKALAKNPMDRYAEAADLAREVRLFLADEPVSAYREPLSKRARRWARRHRMLVNSTATASAIGLAAAGYVFYESSLRAEQRLTAAQGRVDALMSAEIRAVPQIIEQLAPDRALVRDRLARLARGEDAGKAPRARLAASIAALVEDPAQENFLAATAVDPATPPDDLLVIAAALARRQGEPARASRLARELTTTDGPLTDAQLRSAGLLAWLSPSSEVWRAIGERTARKLSNENVLQLGAWRDVFQPVARTLVEPLRVVEGDRSRPEARERAYTLLLDFADRPGNAERAEDLAALAVEADPARLDLILDRLPRPEDRDRASRWLASRVAEPRTFDEAAAGRQARIALALARLGRFDALWPRLAHRPDPSTRTELIHEMPRYGVDPTKVADRLRVEGDHPTRRALILALGEFPAGSLSEADRDAMVPLLEGWYRTDPDPGIHGAVEWLLRQRLGRGDQVDAIDQSLAGVERPAGRGWFVDKLERTFSIIRGPVTFTMGSPREAEPEIARKEEAAHLRRIPRSFAISSHEVTVAEYAPFLAEKLAGVVDHRSDPQYAMTSASPRCATGFPSWYDAARYCNWLSEQGGISRDQWCYPDKIGPGMKLDKGHLDRTGYRLPTEAEWEFSCRAGTVTSRPHGSSTARLGHFAWFGGEKTGGVTGFGGEMHPVSVCKPNDLGLFDMLGNAMEWCDGQFLPYPPPDFAGPVDDNAPGDDSPEAVERTLRGGTFFFSADLVRSASRIAEGPQTSALIVGFRVARTVR
jgi:serine/threonine protein kinase/formylglycine-generating enzyme required for sulfatase activity